MNAGAAVLSVGLWHHLITTYYYITYYGWKVYD